MSLIVRCSQCYLDTLTANKGILRTGSSNNVPVNNAFQSELPNIIFEVSYSVKHKVSYPSPRSPSLRSSPTLLSPQTHRDTMPRKYHNPRAKPIVTIPQQRPSELPIPLLSNLDRCIRASSVSPDGLSGLLEDAELLIPTDPGYVLALSRIHTSHSFLIRSKGAYYVLTLGTHLDKLLELLGSDEQTDENAKGVYTVSVVEENGALEEIVGTFEEKSRNKVFGKKRGNVRAM